MQAIYNISPEIPDNENKFADEFFKRFSLSKSLSINLDGFITKNYSFPTFYTDVSCAIGIFFCDYQAAKAIMPNPAIIPLRMFGDKTLMVFSCYEYRQVYKIWPYNEIAMAIPVMTSNKINIPILPMLINSWFPQFGYYVFSMPVSSKENQIRGNKIWGLPKITQRIDILRQENECICTAFETDGTPYFSLRVPTQGKINHIDTYSHIYSFLDGNIKKSKNSFKGDFNINNHFSSLWAKSAHADLEYLKIGKSSSASILHSLNINPHPFQFRYTQNMNAAFDLPIS